MRLSDVTQLVVCISVLSASRVFALMVSPEYVATQLKDAPLVAEIQVTGLAGQPHPTWFRITRSRAVVRSLIRVKDDGGWFPKVGTEIELETVGGEADDVGLWIPGYPRPRVGEIYRAYLTRSPTEDRRFVPAAMEFGLIPLRARRAYTRNRTDGSDGAGTGPFLYWDRASMPVPFYISKPTLWGHPDFVPAIEASLYTWREPADVFLDVVPMGCADISMNNNDGVNTVLLITDTWPFDPKVIALTRNFYVSGSSARAGMILDSDIMLNGVDHAFTTTNETGKHDVQNIVTHEAGHFIGIGHDLNPPDPSATMYAVASPNEFNKRVLHTDDLEALHAGYSGVAAKSARISTNGACSLTQPSSSCSAVHRAQSRPGAGTVLGVAFLAILFALGRLWQNLVIARPRRGPKQPSQPC